MLRTASLKYRACVGSVFVLGALLLQFLDGRPGALDSSLESAAGLVLWMALISVAAMSPLPMPGGTSTVSLTTALDFAAILLFGPAVACWVGVLSRLVLSISEKWNPVLPGVLRLGQSILAIGTAGLVYAALGGTTGVELSIGKGEVLPLAAAAAVYFLVKTGIGVLDAGLSEPWKDGRKAIRVMKQALAGDLGLLPFGVLLALTQVRIGPVGVALFLLPLLLARYFFKHWMETRKANVALVRTLMSAVDAADPLTWGHSCRVSRMCVRIGRQLGMADKELEELEVGALLHDIGRTAIRRDILLKPGKLSGEERAILRTHPKVGRDLISEFRFFGGASELVHAHHEQPDGNGYPRGLSGEQIPPGSRIIMVVAAFDALTSDRPYRRGLPPEAAFEELLTHTRTQFFPDVVEALIQLYASGLLFQEFEEAELERYARGQGNSRAVEAFLQTRSGGTAVPEKRGVDVAGMPLFEGGVPVLDISWGEDVPQSDHRIVPLKGKGSWALDVAALSDLGCRRENNEDSFRIVDSDDRARGCLMILADGMGGVAGGEVASRLAVDTVESVYGRGGAGIAAGPTIAHAIRTANQAIHARSAAESKLGGMGTTCTVAGLVGRELTVGHVGDSRAYLVRGGDIEQLTQDHTLSAELVGMGGAANGAASSLLTRSLGNLAEVQVDISPQPIRMDDGAIVVLCSDGLSNQVSPDEIRDIVTSDTPEEACEQLIELARARGGPDNITVIVGKVVRK